MNTLQTNSLLDKTTAISKLAASAPAQMPIASQGKSLRATKPVNKMLKIAGLLTLISLVVCPVPFLTSRAYAQAGNSSGDSSSGLEKPLDNLQPPDIDKEPLPDQVQKAVTFRNSLSAAQLKQIQDTVASHQTELDALAKQAALNAQSSPSQSSQAALSSKLEAVQAVTQKLVAVQAQIDQAVKPLLSSEQLELFNSSKPSQAPAVKATATDSIQKESYTSYAFYSPYYAAYGVYYAYYQYLYAYDAYVYGYGNTNEYNAYKYAYSAYYTYAKPGLEKAGATYFAEYTEGSDFATTAYDAYVDLYDAYYYSKLAYQYSVADYSATGLSYSYYAAYSYGSTAYSYLSSAYSNAYSAYQNR